MVIWIDIDMLGYRNREGSVLPPEASVANIPADAVTTSRLVGGRDDSSEGAAVNSLRRQLHLPAPVDCPLGV